MLDMDRHQNSLIEGGNIQFIFENFKLTLCISNVDYVPLNKAKSTSKDCSELFCGLPLYSTRMIEDM